MTQALTGIAILMILIGSLGMVVFFAGLVTTLGNIDSRTNWMVKHIKQQERETVWIQTRLNNLGLHTRVPLKWTTVSDVRHTAWPSWVLRRRAR